MLVTYGNPGRWAVIVSIALSGLVSSCNTFDDYLVKDEDAFLGPPPDITPPEVQVISPSGVDSLHASPAGGRSVLVEVTATDDKELRDLEIWIDNDLKALLIRPPFVFDWDTTALEEGSVHAIWATGIDASSNSATSDTVYAVVFNAGPRIAITTPTRGDLATGNVEIVVDPEDPRIPIARVDFLVDGLPIGTDSSSPFEFVWDSTGFPPGDHFLTAMAVADNGALGISPFVSIALNNSPPRLRLTFPESGRVVARLGTVPFSATVMDTVHGAITDSLFWVSDLDGPLGRGGYLTITDLTPGVHQIQVRARNAWGLESTDQIQLVVRAEPTVSLCWDLFNPFLLTECYICHNDHAPQHSEHGFDLSGWITMLEGGRSQREFGLRAIVPCKPDSSLLWMKISGGQPPVGNSMPPEGTRDPLSPERLEKIRIWIEEGAPPDPGLEDGC